MRVYQVHPAPGQRHRRRQLEDDRARGGPFSDADGYGDASLYSTIGVGQFEQGEPPLLFARQHSTWGQPHAGLLRLERPEVDGRVPLPASASARGRLGVTCFPDQACSEPSCYQTLQAGNLAPGARDAPDDTAELMGRTQRGSVCGTSTSPGRGTGSTTDYDWTSQGSRRSPTRQPERAIPIARSPPAARPGPGAATASAAVRPTTRRCRPPTSTA